MTFSDNDIVERLGRANPEDREGFSLTDLVGKVVSEHRRVPYEKLRNPSEDSDDPQAMYPFSPKNFNVLIFNDRTFLATENRGDGGDWQLSTYYFDGDKTYYSERLFE